MSGKLNFIRFVFLSLLLCVSTLYAQPANILVWNLTFTRPENWVWEEPPKTSSALNRFTIPSGGVVRTDVRFYIVKKDVASERAALLQQFPGSSATDIQEQEIKVGKQKIVYFKIGGTYKYKDTSARPDQLWLGAAIPSGKQFVYVRINGPRAEVDAQLPIFKKMVENAVREREGESIVQ
ncbi:MAG: hypothetical protein JWM68_5826 [Verrucomicrobiales bacterium]|nr:hypothetical protein [Verrucomicrobiales bacterium]